MQTLEIKNQSLVSISHMLWTSNTRELFFVLLEIQTLKIINQGLVDILWYETLILVGRTIYKINKQTVCVYV